MASCLLAALGNEKQTTETEYIRARVGALFLAAALNDLKQVRCLLTPTKKA